MVHDFLFFLVFVIILGEFVIEMGFIGFQCNGDKKRLRKEAVNEKVS